MDDSNYKIIKLIQRYFANELGDAERQELEEWLAGSPEHRELFDAIRDGRELDDRERVLKEIGKTKALGQFEKKIGYQRQLLVRKLLRYAAIIVVPVLAVVSWQWMSTEEVIEREAPLAIVPGHKQAILTLEDGSSLVLDPMKKDEFNVCQSGARISNVGNKIVYLSDTSAGQVKKGFNHLNTPRGGEFDITLADGTRVFLNADTKLKYPVVFDADKREVYVSGEAYFEVAKEANRPFYVVTEAIRIEVYGTSFNVNTRYADRVQAVLVNGKIGVNGNQSGTVYRVMPSELIEFTAEGIFIRQEKVDVLRYVAWREGQLIFEDETLEQIMNTLSLWYDVDVFFVNPDLKAHRFTGHMKKYECIDTILDAISKILGVTFTIKEKTITVTN